MNSFSVRTKIMEGGGLETLAPKLHKVFIVTDGFMASSGKVSYITEKLDRAGAEYRVFDQVKADPDIGTVTKGVDMIQEFHPDAVIAFGGGSPIDAAKAIVFFAAKTCDMRECMFIAVPTTSGTGSEVSKFAVITDPEKEVKYPLVEDSLLPDVAILDAELTVSVPPSVTADTGIDVFTHAVEALVSTAATDFSDAAAEKAIKLVRRHLMTAYHQPGDMAARQGMHNASCLAGVAFSNSGLGLNHGMAHALGARFHIPHGRANGILLPYVMSFNAGCSESLTPVAKRYAKIARLLGLEATSVRQSALNLIRTARRYVEQLNIPSSIQVAGVDKAEFEAEAEAMAEAALADRCTATNPRPCSKEEILQVFHKAYIGRLP
ncbi:1-propanol dehydrogenase PduQ [Intestinimonas butyriciproducens]|uniref:1-propanol dehydrogenase PduQ n=1 Tax=Intestinimonas butyriciproducens TaxID=1297617 RepID=UPI00189AE1E9|nr:1-propanol dehydrogenase PduQ [Intestinimonas butyriciproducens]MBU5231066.1 iron-containing alcohol dehydrogenase [Intestinimonas butyriciproducens]MDB7831739.1 iron-containing alcohol dehydrogenase [Intestinimonas butyriciproducens]